MKNVKLLFVVASRKREVRGRTRGESESNKWREVVEEHHVG